MWGMKSGDVQTIQNKRHKFLKIKAGKETCLLALLQELSALPLVLIWFYYDIKSMEQETVKLQSCH